ncbi:MAG TPA: hypothetical protein VJM50_24770 [Pyrinomonadaceae bacterium]|nr:hypothetical protein [Pyrinomonadaceae bacterium]
MDFWVELGVTAVLSVLRSKSDVKKWAPKLAKIYAKVEKVAQLEPALAQAIHDARSKEGLVS